MGSLALGMKDLETAFGWSDQNPMPIEKYATWPNRMLELGSGFVMRISIRNYSFIAHDMLSR